MLRALMLLSCFLPAILQAESRDPAQYFFSDTFGDFQEELETAQDEDKIGIMLFFEMDECPFCARMRENILNQSQVQDYFQQHFLMFTVDIEGDIEIINFKGEEKTQKDFAFKDNGVRATPVTAFYDLNGKRVARYTGPVTSADEMLLLGQYVVEGAYADQSFSRYKRTLQKK